MPTPLTKEELSICTDVARDLLAREATLPFAIVPYTGLTKSELLHLKPDWIHWGNGDALGSDRPPVIEVPPSSECQNLKWDKYPPHYRSKPGVCRLCEIDSRDKWKAAGENRLRSIPVIQPIAQKTLRRWFQTHSRDGVPYGANSLLQITTKVSRRAPIDRKVRYADLVYTFMHICAEQGLEKETIFQISPTIPHHPKITNILRKSSTDYDIEIRTIDRLRTLRLIEPATINELSEEMGTQRDAEKMALQRFVENEIAVKTGVRTSDQYKPVTYAVNPELEIDEGIPCPRPNCDERFPTLRGRSVHQTRSHS
jgi:hypothetical protein